MAQFTSQTAAQAGANGGRKRGNKAHYTPEIAVGIALRYLVRTVRGKNLPSYVRNSAAATLLRTLHDAGVKPSQRDLAVVFRGLARASRDDQPNDSAGDSAANDASDVATPTAKK